MHTKYEKEYGGRCSVEEVLSYGRSHYTALKGIIFRVACFSHLGTHVEINFAKMRLPLWTEETGNFTLNAGILILSSRIIVVYGYDKNVFF